MRKLLPAALLALVIAGSTASGGDYLGWADSFLGATVDVYTNTVGGTFWAVQHHWHGTYGEVTPDTWQYVGGQSANATGRANARERVMFRFRESFTSGCSNATTTLTRYRTTSPPAIQSSCVVTATLVGSVSQTYDTCGFNAADTYGGSRFLPEFNFSAETALPGATIGYRSIASVTVGANNATDQGCFKILWLQ